MRHNQGNVARRGDRWERHREGLLALAAALPAAVDITVCCVHEVRCRSSGAAAELKCELRIGAGN
jgi:hypothetical protein